MPLSNSCHSDFVERLTAYVSDGSVEQATHAATALAAMENAELVLVDAVADWSDDLYLNSPALLNRLASFAQVAMYTPSLIHPHIASLIQFVENDLLMAKTKEVSMSDEHVHFAMLIRYIDP